MRSRWKGTAAPACDAGRELEEGGGADRSVNQSPYKARPMCRSATYHGATGAWRDSNDIALTPNQNDWRSCIRAT